MSKYPSFYSLDHPRRSHEIYDYVQKSSSIKEKNLGSLFLEDDLNLSQALERTAVQDPCSARNVVMTRKMATFLVDDESRQLNKERVALLYEELKKNLYLLGPGRQYDSSRREHILRQLGVLLENSEVRHMLRGITKPYSNQHADEVIRQTLGLSSSEGVTDLHARRAVLSSWLCYLRQSVGSCFATAPCILVHDDQGLQYLREISELLSTGRLKRVVGGVEDSVPFSPSWGMGDLRRSFLVTPETEKRDEGIWDSPGLQAALRAAGFWKEEEESRRVCRDWVLRFVKNAPIAASTYSVTLERLLKELILLKYELTQEDVIDYENRPRQMVQSSLLLHVPKSGTKSGGKGARCAAYFDDLEKAKSAFKAIADNALLKSWEFTVASFAESRVQFARWNLYSSLGLSAQEPGGIGQCLVRLVQEKLDYENSVVQERQDKYQEVADMVKYLEARMGRARDKTEAQYIQVEYQNRWNEMRKILAERDESHARAQCFSNLINTMTQYYDTQFPHYFQEVYDAELLDVKAGMYDDSPAGFRLLYKHGRSNTSQWTMIQSPNEFVDALAAFFVATEGDLSALPEVEGIEKDIGEIVTGIMGHVRSREFLETAFDRMARAHNQRPIKNPLENLEKVEKKPWVYTSGGTMNTLVQNYFSMSEKVTERGRWVEDPHELLVFLIDQMKKVSEYMKNHYRKNPSLGLLMHSPTHAFVLKPGLHPFCEAWESSDYTYTWVRDQYLEPVKRRVDRVRLDGEAAAFCLERLSEEIPSDFQPHFRSVFSHFRSGERITSFRNAVLQTMKGDQGFSGGQGRLLSPWQLDSWFFEHLPLMRVRDIPDALSELLKLLPGLSGVQKKNLLELYRQKFESGERSFLTSREFQFLVRDLLMLSLGSPASSENFPWLIRKASAELGFSWPLPMIVADTNWVTDFFAFVVNPGTEALEFWRVDCLGTRGTPMLQWKHWLDGSRKDSKWVVYRRPEEYLLHLTL